MAIDITPELYDRIMASFQKKYEKAELLGTPIGKIRKKLEAGTATFQDADLYAVEVGSMLSNSLKEVLQLDEMPNGTLYYNIAQRTIGSSLQETYGLVSSVAAEVQTEMNAAAGVGLKAITPKANSDRINGLVDKAAKAADQGALDQILTSPVENVLMSAVDDTVKANAGLQAKAGLQPIIKRTSTGHCCDWCDALAGTYKYPDDVPDDVYRRHQNCRCTVEYIGAGKRQDVWSKREDVRTKQEAEELERNIIERKTISEQVRRSALTPDIYNYGKGAVVIDQEYISSQEYRMKYHGITGNHTVDDQIYENAKEILNNKNGSMLEELVLLDADSGELILAIRDSDIKNKITYTTEAESLIKAEKKNGKQIVAIHNHPEGYPPTADDAVSALVRGYDIGVVCGHNGKIYTYKPSSRKYTQDELDLIHDAIVGQYIQGMDIDKHWTEMLRLFGINITVR